MFCQKKGTRNRSNPDIFPAKNMETKHKADREKPQLVSVQDNFMNFKNDLNFKSFHRGMINNLS